LHDALPIYIGLDLGLISPTLFTMLVIMALVTTFMAGPALKLLDPRGELSAPPEEEFRRTGPAPAAAPEKAILVAPIDIRNIDALLAIAEPLARSEPPRELILARLIEPSRLAAGVATDDRALARETEELNRRRDTLIEQGTAARAVAYTSPDPGADLVRLAAEQEVDLLLMDGRRPLVGESVPRGPVMPVIEHAPCDVASLVERAGVPQIDADHPVVVPFGGVDHDWAALELGAWLAYAQKAPLKMLGASSANGQEGRDASRLLANASLVVQQFAAVSAEPAHRLEPVGHPRSHDGVGELRVQPRVVDRDRGLVCEGAREIPVVVSPVAVTLVDHLDDADRLVAHLQRQREHVLRHEARRVVHHAVEARIALRIGNDRRLAAVEDGAGDPFPGRHVPPLDLLPRCAGGDMDDEVARVLVEQEQRARLSVQELGRRLHDQLQQLVDVQRRVE